MPIMIEEMQAEVRPDREDAQVASTAAVPDAARETETVEATLRELAIRHERRQRWQAD